MEFLRALPGYPRKHVEDRDREHWRKLTGGAWIITLRTVGVPSIISNDKELMIVACFNSSKVYRYLEKFLKEDRDVLDAPLDGNAERLSTIPDWLQLRYPDLVIRVGL